MSASPGFTHGVRKVLAGARSEAISLQHDHIGTGHILLAMTGEADGIAVTVLRDSGIELDGLRHRIAESVRKSPAHAHQELPYTRAAKEALEFAVRAAIERGYASVGTELLLLGILQDAGATAAEVIATSGVTADRITSRVSRLLEITHPV